MVFGRGIVKMFPQSGNSVSERMKTAAESCSRFFEWAVITQGIRCCFPLPLLKGGIQR